MTFTTDDCLGIQYKHDDPLVISLDLNNPNVVFRRKKRRQYHLQKLLRTADPRGIRGVANKSQLPPDRIQRIRSDSRGKITLPVTVGEGQAARTLRDEFFVMDCDSVYNVIMGRTIIHKMQAISSTYHQMMIYVSDAGFAERVRGDQEVARRTCHTAIRKPRLGDGSEDDEGKKDPSREESEAKRRKAGTRSLDIFAWSAADMPGIDPKMICHKLDVNVEAQPIKQKKRNYTSEKNKAIA
ncbi:uncharacterized protein [Spinacia oleracea]|uniref:Uncharacterized protein n=1 Tax=Spinacia oleracea TaxID=3562 RepID=A0ABM3QXY2_SPIOL|nr:uncharacterized protein LOC130463165 [Spinacia oleracea]